MRTAVGWLLLMLALSFPEGWAGEGPYDFRKRLEIVHRADRRDPAAKCAADEYEIAGCALVLTAVVLSLVLSVRRP